MAGSSRGARLVWTERDKHGVIVYDDEVHGSFRLGLLASLLMNQPELGRLGSLKQLGCCDRVFANANHNRLQHSKGVAHLAYTWVEVIAKQQEADGHRCPQHTRLTPLDLELLEVAGLCHDLGHGPFSHVFEAFILPALGISGWHHEALSSFLLYHMLQRVFMELGLMQGDAHAQQEVQQLLQHVHGAVADLIRDKLTSGHWDNKQFVRQIVASCLDADKVDYLLRDMLRDMLKVSAHEVPGLQELFAGADGCRASTAGSCSCCKRQLLPKLCQLIGNSRLVVNKTCFAAKDPQLVQQLYRARYLMHEHVYQHAAVKGFELMVAHVLQLAAPKLSLEWLHDFKQLLGDFEELVEPATADPAAAKRFVKLFLALRDSALDEARRVAVHSADSSDDLSKALDILDRIDGGNAYSCVEEDDVDGCMSGHVWEEDDQLCQTKAAGQAVIEALASSSSSSSGVALQSSDISVVYCKYDHCNGSKDPLELLWLWSEGEDGRLTKAQASWSPETRPKSFITRKVRVYLTKLCSPEEEEMHMAALQQALRLVLTGLQAAAVPAAAAAAETAAAAAAAAEPAAAAVAEAAAEPWWFCEEDEEDELLATQRLDEMQADECEDTDGAAQLTQEEVASGMLESTAAAAAGVAAGTELLSAGAAAAAGGLLPGKEGWLSSQAEEVSEQLLTPTPAAARLLPRRSSVTRYSQQSSQAAETLQQREEQMMPFKQLQLGEGDGLNPSSSLQPAASMVAASSYTSRVAPQEAASAGDVVDLTGAEQAGVQQQQQRRRQQRRQQQQQVKMSNEDYWAVLRAQGMQNDGPGRRATGSRPQEQLPNSKRAKHSDTK